MGNVQERREGTGAFLALIAILAVLVVALGVRLGQERGPAADPALSDTVVGDVERDGRPVPPATDDATPDQAADTNDDSDDGEPRWRTERVFGPDTVLVAYYGTAGTGALGVLGERPWSATRARLDREVRAFAAGGRDAQPVYELIVGVADDYPGPDGDYSHDLTADAVRPYLAAARRQGARVVLDLQTGRTDFLTAARRWEWALRMPHVGLALDPEWRMGRGQVPGQVIGAVRAAEVNRVSAWLAALVRRHDLPEKVFVVHQFRTSMLPDIHRIRTRPGLALVQHVDGFGTPGQKRDTFAAVAHPRTFHLGFKLFYDEDTRLMGPGSVNALRPRVRFVSYQ